MTTSGERREVEEKMNWYEGVPAPVDADGEPIRIGDVLHSRGNECCVVSITVKANEVCVGVRTDEGVFLPSVNPKYLSRKNPEPLDSWEALLDDLDGTKGKDYAVCHYANGRLTKCDACRFCKSPQGNCEAAALSDIALRIRALRKGERYGD